MNDLFYKVDALKDKSKFGIQEGKEKIVNLVHKHLTKEFWTRERIIVSVLVVLFVISLTSILIGVSVPKECYLCGAKIKGHVYSLKDFGSMDAKVCKDCYETMKQWKTLLN